MLTGGEDADRFVFTGAWAKDTITDFEQGLDQINLRDLRDENGGRALSFNQLYFAEFGSTVRIGLDLDRDGIEDKLDLDEDGTTEYGRIDILHSSISEFSKADFIF